MPETMAIIPKIGDINRIPHMEPNVTQEDIIGSIIKNVLTLPFKIDEK